MWFNLVWATVFIFCFIGDGRAIQAKDLTLNDLPQILKTLKNCHPDKTYFGLSESCEISGDYGDDVSAVVETDHISLLYHHKGIDLIGRGSTVTDAINDLAGELHSAGAASDQALKVLTPYLPTQ